MTWLGLTVEQWLELAKALGPTIVAVGSGIWVVITFRAHQREVHQYNILQADKENRTRMFEARRPFNDKQLALYSEAAQVAGRIVTSTLGSPTWQESVQRFHQLFWTELSMVEDEGVKRAMQNFAAQLHDVENEHASSEQRVAEKEHAQATVEKETAVDLVKLEENRKQQQAPDMEDLRQLSYQLASALRRSIESSWQVNLSTSTIAE